jgi:streptogramin lyase
MNKSGNNQFSSIAFNSHTGTMWITASNRNDLYYVSTNGDRLNNIDIPGIGGGADDIKVHPNGDIYFSTGTGITRMNSSGNFIGSYNLLTTNGLLGGAPKTFDFDSEGNIKSLLMRATTQKAILSHRN